MSRLKRFAHSLFSGYLTLAANTIFTLASVRLALHYLPSNDEFSLWGLATSIFVYVNLVDLGLTGSASRILIDYKDRRASGEYGSIVQTTALVGLVQGLIVLLAGLGVALVAGPMLHVPDVFRREFFWLLTGQGVVTAVGMSLRWFNLLLAAHQRFDVLNHAASLSFAANLAVAWLGFAHGWGVLSVVAGQLAALIVTTGAAVWFCRRLGLLPGRSEWGRASWQKFRELFAFAQDIFLYSLGCQLVAASQAILLTPLVGLSAAGIWTVNTRVFLMLTQVIYRIFDFAGPALAEMMVRGERDRLKQRFQQIIEVSTGLAVAAAVMFALGNSLFVHYWSQGRIHWPRVNDALLAGGLVLGVLVHAHTGLVGQSKQFKFMRYLFALEGGTFIGLMFLMSWLGVIPAPVTLAPGQSPDSAPAPNPWGFTVLLLLSVGSCLAFSFWYGLYRTRDYFKLSGRELYAWHRNGLSVAGLVLPVAAVAWWGMRQVSLPWQWGVILPLTGLWTLLVWLRFGLPAQMRTEIWDRFAKPKRNPAVPS